MAVKNYYFNITDSLISWIGVSLALRLENEGMVSWKDAENRGIESGFEGLDLETRGFHNSELIYIGAPVVRKTDFALAMVANMLKFNKTKVGYFSLEMREEFLIKNLSSILVMEKFGWSDFIFKEDMPFFCIDTPNMNSTDFLNNVHKLRMKYGIQILFIDCLEFVPLEIFFLKELAVELDIPVIVLAKTTGNLKNKEPDIKDLYICSDVIEQNTDLIMFLHHSDVVITKNKNGYEGIVKDVRFKRRRND